MAQTFLVAFESRESFDHQWEDARPWLFGIAQIYFAVTIALKPEGSRLSLRPLAGTATVSRCWAGSCSIP